MAQSVLGEMIIKLTGSNVEFDNSINQSENRLQNFSESAKKLGGNLTKFVTAPIIALGTLAVKAFAESEDAGAKFTAALLATGKQASISTENISAYTKELQNITTFEDDAQLAALGMVQQLANLDEKGLKTILPRMLDFSAAMGVDLETAASLFGKTLGSTTNALGRYGIQLKDNITPEQKLIDLTNQLDSKFKGFAENIAKKGTGPLKQFQNTLGDLAEEFGKNILPTVNDLLAPIKVIVVEFGKLDDNTKKMIITGAALAAAIGPIVGLAGNLTTAITSMAGPVGIVVAALGALSLVILGINKGISDYNNRFTIAADKAKNEATEINNLVTEYDRLKKESENNLEAKSQLLVVEQQLKQVLPGSTLVLDEQARVIGLNTTALKEHLAELSKVEKINLQGEVTRLKSQLADTEKEVDKQVKIQKDIKAQEEAEANRLRSMGYEAEAVTFRSEAMNQKILDLRKKAVAQTQLLVDAQNRLNELEGNKPNSSTPKKSNTSLPTTPIFSERSEGLKAFEEADAEIKAKLAEENSIENKFALLQQENAENLVSSLDQQNNKLKEQEENYKSLLSIYEKYTGLVTNSIGSVFGSLGEALVSGEIGWKQFGKAAIESVAGIIDAIGSEALAEAAKQLAIGFANTVYNPVASGAAFTSAAQWGIAGGLAKLGAGVVRGLAAQIALAGGGYVTGPTNALIGEAGSEFVLPDKREYMTLLANKIDQARPSVTNNNYTSASMPGEVVLNIDGSKFKAYITEQSRRGNIQISGKRGISKR